ncbi:MAG TPA: N-acetylneuraminate synthase family protein [Candidatus Gastranaerophilaceae bacterium]|nr:N-acetylneuraminate synthase family protein [Candidatus Gastranaerophilaceae bacterium]HPT42152.1 N-acetylneuraminate synthase family protein [Candidatus Gastranaerophilaceae bacterium]
MNWDKEIFINKTRIAFDAPVYFIADIAANHDGNLSRAKDLIWLAKESGADCAKFQHFIAEKIVSDFGFKNLKTHQSHQSTWKKSVFKVYKEYECKRDWTSELAETAKKAEIEFMTTPYDFEILSEIDNYVNAYKIGSGDITWHEFLKKIARLNKPVLLACGASDINEVKAAVEVITKINKKIVLMQCNTNYTASLENFKYINLNVLKTFAKEFPNMVLGLSNHTAGCSTVLGAVALGARVIEKHFTDNNSRTGPDHKFAMNPETWKEMVERTRELELALGDGVKRVEENEKDTVIVQRRCLRLKNDLKKGDVISESDIEILRPAPENSFPPYEVEKVTGKKLNSDKKAGDAFYKGEIEG